MAVGTTKNHHIGNLFVFVYLAIQLHLQGLPAGKDNDDNGEGPELHKMVFVLLLITD